MKTRLNTLVKGLFVLAAAAFFVGCQNSTAKDSLTTDNAPSIDGGITIAYVEIDSLITNYNFWKDVTEAMTKKQEDINLNLSKKQKDLENDIRDFQNKLQHNAFMSETRAQQEQQRIMKKEQDLQQWANKQAQEVAAEAQKNDLAINDAVKSYIEEYNKTHKYTFIFTNAGNSTFLFADKAYDITQDIIDGLNEHYTSKEAVK